MSSLRSAAALLACATLLLAALPTHASWVHRHAAASRAPVAPAPVASSPQILPALLDLSDVDWSNQTATSLAALDPSAFLSITADDLSSIPADACAGFAQAQLTNTGSATGSDVCTGFESACVKNIPAAAMAGLSSACATSLSLAAVSALTGDQVSHGLPDSVCSVWSAAQTFGFGVGVCSKLRPNCLTAWPAPAFVNFSAACIGDLNPFQVSQFSAEQVGQIAPPAMAGLGNNNNLMAAGCAGLTQAQAPYIPTTPAFLQWTAACNAAFTPSFLGGWLRAQMRAFPASLFWQWTVEQVAGLSPNGAWGISPAAASGLPPALCAGFSAPQIAQFHDFYTSHVCLEWSAACLSNIRPAEYAGFTEACVQRLTLDALSVLTADQLSYIQPVTFFALTAEQLAVFSPAAISGITAGQMELFDAAFPSHGCSGFGLPFSSLTPAALSAVTPQCASHLSATALSAPLQGQLSNLSPAAWGSLSRAGVGGLEGAQCLYLTPSQLAVLGAGSYPHDAALGLEAPCFAALRNDTCASISPELVQLFDSAPNEQQEQLGGLKRACLGALSPATCAAANATFFLNIDKTQCGDFTPACFAAITPQGAAGLVSQCVDEAPAATFQALSEAAFQALQWWVWRPYTPEQVAALTPTQCSYLTGAQLDMFSPRGVTGFTPSCLSMLDAPTCASVGSQWFVNLTSEACGGFAPTCFASLTASQAPALTPECVAALSGPTLAAMPLPAFEALSVNVFASLSRASAAELSEAQCSVLTGNELNALGSSAALWDAPLGLSPDCLGSLDPKACAAVEPRFFESFNGSTVTLAQLEYVSDSCVMALSCSTVASLQQTVIDSFHGSTGKDVETACSNLPPTPDDDGGDRNHTTRNILIGVGVGLFVLIVVSCVWWRVSAANKRKHERNMQSLDHHYMQAPEDM